MKLLTILFLAGARLAGAQTLTPRQLFYQEEKPVSAPAARKSAPRKSPPKVAGAGPVRESPPSGGEIKLPKAEPPTATNAAYSKFDRPLGLRYSIVQVSSGSESEVSPSATFRSGDMVRVKVEANRDGYLYVIARGPSGNWTRLFPAADIRGGDNHIAARQPQRLPSETQAFAFDEQAGQEQLFVILTDKPAEDVDRLLAPSGKPDPKLAPGALISARAELKDDAVDRIRKVYSRDLIVQTVTASQPAADKSLPENAVYVVSQSGDRVVADIRLEHR